MTSIKIIRTKIESVINTQKITKTMEMVAIAKMKKAKKKLFISKPYSHIIKKIIFNILEGNLKYKHIFLNHKKNIKKIGIIVISTNRGLCGSLNTNLFKFVNSIIQKYSKKGIQCNLYVIGKKGLLFFNRLENCFVSKMIDLKDNIQEFDILKSVNKIFKKYELNKIHQLFITSNTFKSNISQIPNIIQLLPIQKNDNKNKKSTLYSNWDYLYEPNSQLVLDIVLKKYIIFNIYKKILENILCEQTARMIAMKTASDNSNNIIQELQLLYNKMRQFSITQELTEIISGASLVSKNE